MEERADEAHYQHDDRDGGHAIDLLQLFIGELRGEESHGQRDERARADRRQRGEQSQRQLGHHATSPPGDS